MPSRLPVFKQRRTGAPVVASRTIARPRLAEALQRVFDVGIAVVTAGAGYGKTVLLSSWASQLRGTRVVWITCHEEHNDARWLRDELAAARGGIGHPSRAHLGDVAAGREANESVVIVLDDVHLLTSETATGVLTRFLEDRPDNVFVVVSGRDDSSIPWHRFSARGELTELRGSDLAFTAAEAADLLTETFGLDIASDDTDRLRAVTEGWATGLCLAGHALRDPRGSLLIGGERLGHHRHVRGFMDSEVLDRLPAGHVRFLEDTSLLQRLDPELCDLLTDRSDSLELLESFVERNLFTVEVASAPPTYRYHTLFADCLRARAERRGSEHATALLGVAARWYEQRGEMHLAIDAALRAGDIGRVERLIEVASGPALRAGFAATIVRWVSALPATSLDRRPDLALLLSRAAGASGDLVLAQAGITTIGRLLDDPSVAVTPSVRVEYHELVFLVHLWTGDFARAREDIEQALDFMAEHPADPGYEMYGLDRPHLEMLAAVPLLLLGELDEATSRVDALLEPGLLVNPERDATLALGIHALALAWRTEGGAAARSMVEACRARVHEYRGRTGGPFILHVAGAWCADLDRAGADLTAARAIALELGLPVYVAVYSLAEARFALRTGSWDHAARALAKADAVLSAMPAAQFLTSIADGLRVQHAERSGTEMSLTDQELSVLRELASGASRREAATRVYLSINTVKTHLRTAYRKLGVTNSADAIERARALGLLASPIEGVDRRPGEPGPDRGP
jgi:ATP/maltotriose-dependent transcriptional regulator MalT